MNKGVIEQLGSARALYEEPVNRFVAEFIGESNLLDGIVRLSTADSISLALADGSEVSAPPRKGLIAGQRVKLVIRPENILLDGNQIDGLAALPAIVEAKIYQGALIRYRLSAAGQSIVAEVQNQVGHTRYDPGSRIIAYWHPERTEVLPIEQHLAP